MRYLCLICIEEAKLEALTKGEFDDLIRDHFAYDDRLRQNGHYVLATALQSAKAATTVRRRQGRTTVTDGPFTETKEQLAGLYLIEARDLNEAIQLAAGIPGTRLGCTEVRPVREHERPG